ncbi:DUF6452 family protein [Polaribacter sp. IC073]|uniref:DUF6452 family protein n=1 Tax=Polaribacter sp. IC073 TaxID=2508540 RepID=UPI0011BD645C|nr:DUF6452 family protein [Polaribacter sp. IC073]TXD49360.1 hypothetical protein ES045_04660 [Polaribacter sp. IC073]
MKKIIPFLLLLLAFFTACEKDDFCVKNPVTSKLKIDFYDDTNRETLKKVQRFSIIAEGKTDSLFTNQSGKNSISIPLNSLTTETVYTLKKNDTDGATSTNEIATFTIKYDTEEEYVSRSCGFKIIFKNVAFSSSTSSWITDFTPTTITNLDDQTTAHVQIFH